MKRSASFFIFFAIVLASAAYATDDSYKPYLHKAAVPDHPKLDLYGTYKTELFPGAATYSYPIKVSCCSWE
jgi:hypothetical protein